MEYICEMSPRGKKWTQDEIIEAFKYKFGDQYDYSKVIYNGVDTPVLIGCKNHGYFPQTPHHHLQGNGCPTCRESHAEREIANWFKENNIPFERYYHFDWLPRGYHVDFYFPEKNIAIEYQGKMHFEPVWGKEELEKQQIRDKLKKELCQKNNLPLYEITYVENVEQRLREILMPKDESKAHKFVNKGRKRIKLTEGQLHKIIKESVKILLRDGNLHGVY